MGSFLGLNSSSAVSLPRKGKGQKDSFSSCIAVVVGVPASVAESRKVGRFELPVLPSDWDENMPCLELPVLGSDLGENKPHLRPV